MEKKLLTLSAKLEELENSLATGGYDKENWAFIIEHNDFLKQPLTLSQFVPCGEDGKPLEKPQLYDTWLMDIAIYEYKEGQREAIRAYQKAAESVLFEGWTVEYRSTIINQRGDIVAFVSRHKVVLDKFVSKEIYDGDILPDNPSIADLAKSTISNPLTLKS